MAVKTIYRLMYWSTEKKGDREEPFGQDDFDMTDHPPLLLGPISATGLRGSPGHYMDGTELSKVYQRLYDDPTIYKIEIWQFFAGFDRSLPGWVRPKAKRR